MPLYEYGCTNVDCHKVVELLRSMKEADSPVICPYCGHQTTRKVSKSGFQLKGGGWASDGYSSK